MRTQRILDPERAQARGCGLRRADFFGLSAIGVTGDLTAWRSPSRYDLLLRDRVVFRRGARFDFVRDLQGEACDPVTAYTILVRDRGGAPLDVLAWHPRSGRAASWLGRSGLLGEDFPCEASSADPLVVYVDVGAWLAACRRGVVVIHERLGRLALLEVGAIRAADLAHGEALEAMLSKVRLPRIVLPAFPNEEEAA